MGSYMKRKEIYQYIRQKGADIILLQETHATDESAKTWAAEWGGEWINSYGTSSARGVAILITRQFRSKIIKLESNGDTEGRLIRCKIEIEDGTFDIFNVYGRNDDHPDMFRDMVTYINTNPIENLVIGGDFNFVLDNQLDAKNRNTSHPNSVKLIKELMNEGNLVDIWRVLNPTTEKYTWRKLRPKAIFSRLDWFLINSELTTMVEECSINPNTKSDHACILVRLRLDKYKRGPGVWKFNTQLLSENKFKTGVRAVVEQAINTSSMMDVFEAWEYIKSDIRSYAKKYSKNRAKNKNENIRHLEKTLELLQTEQVNDPKNEDIVSAIQHIESEINKSDLEKVKSTIFRSKTKFTLEGERNTKFFFSLEKRRYFNRNMRSLRTPCGRIIREQAEILKEQRKFYEELYRADESITFNLVPEAEEAVLSGKQREELDEPINLDEIRNSLFSMANNKCPGLDGLPKEIYVELFEVLGPVLLKLYNTAFRRGYLNETARSGLISLIPKANKDQKLLKSWRPLCMLCLDFKILSKLMAERMKKVLPYIISEEQSGFMKNRLISDNLRKTYDVIKYTSETKKAATPYEHRFSELF